MEKNVAGVKKGAWTKEEDILLKNCIEKFGEGKWHKVPPRAGLNRCRKSCRLRWLNYLRPNLKKGYFTNYEIDLLRRLHKLLGNRWSLIAGRLPGRTANDVKNFWNAHILKKSSAEKNMETKTNITIKPQARTLSKSHVPVWWSTEEVNKNKTNETKDEKKINQSSSTSLTQQESAAFPLINNVPFSTLSEEEVDECIRWWLQTDEPTPPISFSNNADQEPIFSPGQIEQKVTDLSSLLLDVDMYFD